MSIALKAALLSALIFPGVGHFSLKKPVQGSLLVGIAGVCLCFLMTAAMAVVQQLSAKIQSGEVPLDVVAINQLVTQQLAAGNGQSIDLVSWVLLICWVVGVIDSYRIGWVQQRSSGSGSNKSNQLG